MKTFLSLTACIAAGTLGWEASVAQTLEAPSAASPAPTLRLPTLNTRTFELPPDFLRTMARIAEEQEPPRDPFSSWPASGKRTLIAPDPKAILQQLGIGFSVPGATVSFDRGRSQLTMTNTVKELDNMESILTPFAWKPVRQAQVHLEAFSLPPLTARKALIAHPKESDLYAWIDSELAKPGSTVKLERHSIILVRDGQKSKTEGIDEIPQATEFDPGQIPQSISLPAGATSTTSPSGNAVFAPWPRTDTTPQSFSARHAGNTVEVELTFSTDDRFVDLNLAPETTRRVGIIKFGLLKDIFQPAYETQKFAGQASGAVGQPLLLSTFSPPVNTGVPGGNTVDRVWLLFVTVKLPE